MIEFKQYSDISHWMHQSGSPTRSQCLYVSAQGNHACFSHTRFISDAQEHSRIKEFSLCAVTPIGHCRNPTKHNPPALDFLPSKTHCLLWPWLYPSAPKGFRTTSVQLHFISQEACPFLPHHTARSRSLRTNQIHSVRSEKLVIIPHQ